ncbi:MAG: phosphatase PAP2 family protein [Bacteroidetes bacterium]|nr:phosphatase PAP2 family protein [Bacteroidota bacterium]
MSLRLIANFFTYLFHPLLLLTYAVGFIIWTNPYIIPPEKTFKTIFQIFNNTFIYPMIVMFLMIKLKFLKTIKMEDKRDRYVPYIVITIFYGSSLMLAKIQNFPPELLLVLFGSTIAVFSASMVNIYYKISIHAVGVGGIVTLMFGLQALTEYNLFVPLIITIMVAGLVGSSRMYLAAHHPSEIYSGYFVGMISQLLAFNLIAL